MQKRISLQDIFNAAWQEFIIEDRPPAQQQATKYNQFLCSYLTRDGRKCAVGLCIPDGHPYQSVDDTLNMLVIKDSDENKSDQLFDESMQNMRKNLLYEFQAGLHDDLCDKGEWLYPKETRELMYRKIAAYFQLTIPGEESC